MNCSDIQKKLIDYHKGKLSLEEYKEVGAHLASCQDCAKKYDKIANSHIREETSHVPAPIMIKSKRSPRVMISVMILSLIVVSGFVYYYQLLSSDQAVFGETVDVHTVNEDIQLTITHVAASNEETILFFEVEDLTSDEHYFIEPTAVYEQETAVGFPNERILVRNIEEVVPGLTKGQIHLAPIEDGEQTLSIEIKMLFTSNAELETEDWFDRGNRVVVEGSWQLEVPVKKNEGKTYELNEVIDVQGVPVEILEIVLSPTSTELKYSYKRDFSNEHNREIQLSHFVANGEQYDVRNYIRGVVDFELPYIQTAIFKGMYFQDLKNIEVHFGKMEQYVNNQVKIDFDVTDLPYTFEYIGEPITIETVEVDDYTTTITIKEAVDADRSYNFLQLDLNYYRHSGEMDNFTYYSVDHNIETIWFDREGVMHEDPLPSLPQQQFHAPGPQHEYQFFSTEQTVEVSWQEGEEPFVPTFLYIEAYAKATFLDDVAKISIR